MRQYQDSHKFKWNKEANKTSTEKQTAFLKAFKIRQRKTPYFKDRKYQGGQVETLKNCSQCGWILKFWIIKISVFGNIEFE